MMTIKITFYILFTLLFSNNAILLYTTDINVFEPQKMKSLKKCQNLQFL